MTTQSSHNEPHGADKARYLGDLVYGANDGIITTFAVVSGAAGAGLSPGVVVILGIANLIADGISMGLSNYLSLRSRAAYERREREKEAREVREIPDKEREEVREILRKWGVPAENIESATKGITEDPKRWVDLMMREELNIIEFAVKYPSRHGLATFIAFIVAGAMPLLSYVLPVSQEFQFEISIIATALSLFIVGALRTLMTGTNWVRAGLEMLLVGGLAAAAAYFVGAAVKTVFGISL